MKTRPILLALMLLLTGLNACSDWENGLDFDMTDPQEINWVEEIIDNDLLYALGVENIYFGHTPPDLDSLSFMVNRLWYDTCIRYRHVSYAGFDTILPTYNNPGLENSVYKHHFSQHSGNILHHKLYIKDHIGNESIIDCDTAFVIGNGNNFTVYFKWKILSEQEGNPTWAYLVSGTLNYAYDTTVTITQNDTIIELTKRLVGVSKYHIGKKILAIDTPPSQGYYPGTLMFMRPYDTLHILPYAPWDTISSHPSKNNHRP